MASTGRHSSRSLYLLGLTFSLACWAEAAESADCDDTSSVPGEVLVKFRAGPKVVMEAANAVVGGQVVKSFLGDPDLYLIHLPENIPVDQAVAFYNASKAAVEYAEKNLIYCPVDTTPNDPLLGSQWGLVGVNGIRAPLAWDYSTGAPGVTIADNDTGIDLNHPDLVANLGYAVSFVGGSPQDTNSHGTHTAGTIGAAGNNGIGVAGVMWSVNLWALKICASGCSLSAAVSAIDYGTQNGAWLSNNSWGGGGFSQFLQDAISRADRAGVLFVTAAGNNGSNNDATPFYPCNYGTGPGGLQNVICVASTTSSFTRSSFSNYGSNSVHLGAPGSSILSTVPGGYGLKSGTSMASPHVAGVAGLIWSLNPLLSHYQVKDIILNTVRPLGSLPVISGGVLDAGAALQSTPF